LLSALANGRFTAYLIGAALADCGYWVAYVAQGWLVLRLTNSPFWLGMIGASSYLPFLLFSLPGGTLADRFDRRMLISSGNLAIAAVAALAALLVARDAITIVVLAVLTFVLGTLLAIEAPVDRAWFYDLVEGKRLGVSIALSSLEWSVARTVGPAIGGLAVATIGLAAGYATFALMVLPIAVLAIVLSVRDRNRPASAASDDESTGKQNGNERNIITFSIVIAIFTATIIPYITFLPDIARNTLGLDARGYGLLAACGGIGSMTGALALGAIGEVPHKGRAVPIIAVVGAALLALFTLMRSPLAAGAILVVMGAIDTVTWALANTYVQQCASDARRGRANAIFALAFGGGIPIGNFVLGAIAGRYGSLVALEWSAAVAAASAALFWVLAPRAREAA
jgi:predicted MFS family arabinose efflux permease